MKLPFFRKRNKSRHVSPQRVRQARNLEKFTSSFREILGGADYVVADIGARSGIDPPWSFLQSMVNFVLFEPDIEEAQRLSECSKAGTKVIPCAVWDSEGEFPFYVTRNRSLCSMLAPNEEIVQGSFMYDRNFYHIDHIETVKADRLGKLLRDYHVPDVDFIKIDIQGGEVHALKSLDDVQWDCLLGINTEAYSAEIYNGGSTIADQLSLFYEKGFEIFDIETILRFKTTSSEGKMLHSKEYFGARPGPCHRGRAMVYDILLLRNRNWLLARGQSAMIRKSVFTYCLFELFDQAMDLVLQAGKQGIISANTEKSLVSSVRELHWASLSRIRRLKESIRIGSYVLPRA